MSDQLLANLLIASNGATTLAGRSRGLSFRADRERFHQIRSSARAIVIGGGTYRAEPYLDVTLPLYVASRGFSGAPPFIISASPLEVIEMALHESGAPVLIEGGVEFLARPIEMRLIDKFYISRSIIAGDGNFFDEDLLRGNYRITDTEEVTGGRFEIWRPINQ